MIRNNLYPPIMNSTYAPAFLINSGDIQKDICRVPFSLSQYNSPEDILNVQVSFSDQDTNISLLDENKYPCGIMITNLKKDKDTYYIEINKKDIQGGNFKNNKFYKVQIRFTSIEAAQPPIKEDGTQAIDSWLTANLNLFSEWSTVCLVRGISKPTLNLIGLDENAEYTIFNVPTVDIVGKITFADKNETDHLKSYKIQLYKENGELQQETETIYANKYNGINQINYTFKYGFQEDEKYYIIFSYETANLYREEKKCTFLIIQNNGEKLNGDISAAPEEDNGRIKIELISNDNKPILGNVTIRRTDSKSNFTIWEDIYTQQMKTEDILNLVWYDYTVESGVWYKYCAQKRNSVGLRGVISNITEPQIVQLEDIFLKSKDGQLKIRFNPNISSFKHTIAESKVDTIGSKYPYIKRNGNMNYKTFPISGLISYFMDDQRIFKTKEDLFGDSLILYKNYNDEQWIDDYGDITLEKIFRETVMDFLYKNDVKLFKSATEGNILIKLMDLNFTPEVALGRQLYSFSATACEIDDFNLDNCSKYKIQDLGYYEKNIVYPMHKLGQYMETIKAGENVFDRLKDKYSKDAYEGYVVNIDSLNYLHLTFDQPPYLIGENDQGPYPINDKAQTYAENQDEVKTLGYIAYINEIPVVVSAEGIYELDSENTHITSLSFPIDTKVTIDYNIYLNQTEDNSNIVKSSNYYKTIGQYWGLFNYKDSIYKKIWNKYYENYSTYIQSLLSLDEITIEADPSTVVYIKESDDKDFQKHIIGETALLSLKNKGTSIEDIYFMGIHLEEANQDEAQRQDIPDGKYIETGITVESFEDIKKPIKNGVYTLNEPFLQYLEKIEDQDGLIVEEQWVEDTQGKIKTSELVTNNKGKKETSATVTPYIKRLDIKDKTEYKDFQLLGNHYRNAELTGLDSDKYDSSSKFAEVDHTKVVKILNQLYEINGTDVSAGINEVSGVKTKGYDNETDTLYIKLKDIDKKPVNEMYQLIVNRVHSKEFALLLQQILSDNVKYIWYKGRWFLFTKDHDLICDVPGLINYVCEIYKGGF